jgi:hypothetical protein
VVRALLGHRSINTTMRHYAGLEGATAARHYDEVLRVAAGHGGESRHRSDQRRSGRRGRKAA